MTGVLSLDIAASTGWAHWSGPGGLLTWGSFRVQTENRMEGQILNEFLFEKMLPLRDRTLPMLVIIERVYMGGKKKGNTPLGLAQYHGIAKALMQWSDNVRIRTIWPSEAKQHFTGHGHATKDMMIWQAEQYGWAVQNDDEADALALMHTGVSRWMGQELHLVAKTEPPLARAG